MALIVVFDTNILLSSVGWRGAPYRCVELARAGHIQGVTCQEIIDELEEKLYLKLKFSDERTTKAIADLLSFLQYVEIPNVLHAVDSDVDDNKIIECATVSNATHIVTGDRRHLLPLKQYGNISIVSVNDFLSLVPLPQS